MERSDELGELCGSYTPWSYGFKALAAAAVLAGVGLLIAADAGRLSQRLTEGVASTPLIYGVGGLLLIVGAGWAVVGLLRLRQAFEVRRHGVRFRSFLAKREIAWRDLQEIRVRKTVQFSSRGRHSSYAIRLTSEGGPIFLSASFLNAVEARGVLRLLKQHHRREVVGESDDLLAPEDTS